VRPLTSLSYQILGSLGALQWRGFVHGMEVNGMGCRTKVLLVLVATVAWGSQAVAKDFTPDVLGNGAPIAAPDTQELEPTYRGEARSLHATVQLALPTWRSLGVSDGFVGQVTMTPEIPGTVVIQYKGLQRFLVRPIDRQFHKHWGKQMRGYVKHSELSQSELDLRYTQMSMAIADHRSGGRWWERDWFYSLPEEQGGAPRQAFVHTIGERVTFLEWGPLTLTNDFKVRIDKYSVLILDADPGRVYRDLDDPLLARDHARLKRSQDAAGEEVLEEDGEEDGEFLLLAPASEVADLFVSEDGERAPWLQSVFWRLKVRPRGKLKYSLNDGVEGGVSVKCTLEVYLGAARDHVLDVEWTTKYDPMEGEFKSALEVALLTW